MKTYYCNGYFTFPIPEQLEDTTYFEADDISILSDSSTGSWPSRRAWEEGSSVNMNKKPGKAKLSACYLECHEYSIGVNII